MFPILLGAHAAQQELLRSEVMRRPVELEAPNRVVGGGVVLEQRDEILHALVTHFLLADLRRRNGERDAGLVDRLRAQAQGDAGRRADDEQDEQQAPAREHEPEIVDVAADGAALGFTRVDGKRSRVGALADNGEPRIGTRRSRTYAHKRLRL